MKKTNLMVLLGILIGFLMVAGNLHAQAKAELSVSIKCPSGKIYAGQELKKTITVHVTNSGKATAYNFSLDLVLSSNPSIPYKFAVYSANFVDDVLLKGGREFVKKLSPGKTIQVVLNGTNQIPTDTPTGLYYLGAVVDPGNQVPEYQTNNNIAFCPLKIKGKTPLTLIKPVTGISKTPPIKTLTPKPQKPAQLPIKPIQYKFEIQGIKRILTRPDKITFQVQYFISKNYPKACFIGATLPGRKYAYKPAGRLPGGIPKGQKHFSHNITVELMYRGQDRYSARSFEVFMYDADKKRLATTTINYAHDWAYIDFQGIKRIFTSPYRVKWQVQYYISPDYPKACFLGTSIPNQASSSSKFGLIPAGRLPGGVPKGQKHFTDNIIITLEYMGTGDYTSSTMELYIYDSDKAFLDKDMVNWGQLWQPPSVY